MKMRGKLMHGESSPNGLGRNDTFGSSVPSCGRRWCVYAVKKWCGLCSTNDALFRLTLIWAAKSAELLQQWLAMCRKIGSFEKRDQSERIWKAGRKYPRWADWPSGGRLDEHPDEGKARDQGFIKWCATPLENRSMVLTPMFMNSKIVDP